MAPREAFERELMDLQLQIEEMSRMVQETYKNLLDAISVKGEAIIKEIIKSDKNFYDMKKRIEEQCLRVIIRQQPIATDLRIVSSILKIVTDIERVGNHAGDIGELILRIQMKPLSDYSVHLEGMITAALELYANAINAYIKDDQAASHQVIRDDDIVDELFNKVKADIIAGLREESTNADEYIDMMMLAKYLEKIGDHAVNVAKWQIFKGEGEMV
jgi:phosphate transport system protein